jgi:CMP-N-acetylneuraminic acid synthetase
MTVIATICARGGSTGVPGKNIRMLHGKPLIAHTIEQALSCPFIDHVYVSTDDDAIADAARTAGAEVPFQRPAELATSSAAKVPVIQHLVEFVVNSGVDVSKIIDLDPTSPLRTQADIAGAFALLDQDTDVVITGYAADKNPYFNMVEDKGQGLVGLVKTANPPITSRQMAPNVYSMNASIYVWHRETLTKGLWDGRARIFEMPRDRSVDIDSPLDFDIVEKLMAEALTQ